MPDLLEPIKEFKVKDQRDKERTFYLSTFPAVQGREFSLMYPATILPKIGDFAANQALAQKMMAYVAVKINDDMIPLTTEAFINSHTGDWETYQSVLDALYSHNCSFFLKGKVLNFLDQLMDRINQSVSKMLTDSLVPSSNPEKPPSAS